MKRYMMTLLLALVAPAMAAEIGIQPNLDRYVADAIEIQTLPNGERVTRLVSRSRITAGQFWVDSVYAERAIVVFQGRGESTLSASVAQGGLTYAEQTEDKERSQVAETRQ